MSPFRRPSMRRAAALPAELAEVLGVGRGDRVLAWSSLVGGGGVVALVDGIRIATPRGQVLRREWMEVDHAVWDSDSSTLLVTWVGTRQPTPLEILDDVGRLPEVLRERVQSSVVLSMTVTLPERAAARIALRRDAAGGLHAQTLLPPRVKADDPVVADLIARATEALWAEAHEVGSPSDRPPSL